MGNWSERIVSKQGDPAAREASSEVPWIQTSELETMVDDGAYSWLSLTHARSSRNITIGRDSASSRRPSNSGGPIDGINAG